MRIREAARRGVVFVAVGVLLYAAVLAASETLVYRHALRNRFYGVKTAASPAYDYVILGASHALPLDFQDMNAVIEQATGAKIINLAMPGAGIVPNRLLLEYFLQRHHTRTVIYVLDSFIFFSREWNEDRLNDVRLTQRAPFDPALARLLTSYAFRRLIGPGVVLDYVSGFSKINNADRLGPDVNEMETKFTRVGRRSERDAKKRIEFLYPEPITDAVAARYVAMFSELMTFLDARGISLIVVKLPVPAYYSELLPQEQAITRRIADLLAGRAAFDDFSQTDNDERFFLDTDHLNRDGVLNFLNNRLAPLLRRDLDQGNHVPLIAHDHGAGASGLHSGIKRMYARLPRLPVARTM